MKESGRDGVKDTLRRPLSFLMSNPAWILILVVFILYFFTRIIDLKGACLLSDESHYIGWAQSARGGELWSSLLYDGKPPLHSWAMVPFLSLFGDPLIAGRATSVLFGAATTIGTILLGKELRDLELGAIAGLLYVISPYTLLFDRFAETESMLLALFVFSIYFAVMAAKSGNLFFLAGTAITTGLALLTKGTARLLYPIVPFALLVRDPLRKEPDTGAGKGSIKGRGFLARWFLAVAISLLAGFGISNLLRLSPAFGRRSQIVATRTKSLGEVFSNIGDFPGFIGSIFATLFDLLTPAVFIICFAGLLLGLIRRWRPSYFLWAWFLASTIIISLISWNYWARFYIVLLPPLLIGGAYALYEFAGLLAISWRRGRETSRMLPTYVLIILMVAASILVAVPVSHRAKEIVECRIVPGGNYVAVHIDEIVDRLEDESSGGKIIVFTGSRDPGFLSRSLSMYIKDHPDVEILELTHPVPPGPVAHPRCSNISELLSLNRERIAGAVPDGAFYVVADNVTMDELPEEPAIDVLARYPNPEIRELDRGTVNADPEDHCFTCVLRVDNTESRP